MKPFAFPLDPFIREMPQEEGRSFLTEAGWNLVPPSIDVPFDSITTLINPDASLTFEFSLEGVPVWRRTFRNLRSGDTVSLLNLKGAVPVRLTPQGVKS